MPYTQWSFRPERAHLHVDVRLSSCAGSPGDADIGTGTTWNPAWSVETILQGSTAFWGRGGADWSVLSFMNDDEVTTGGMRSTPAEKAALAKASHAFNLCEQRIGRADARRKDAKFRAIFPEYAQPEMRPLPNMGEAAKTAASTSVAAPVPRSAPTPAAVEAAAPNRRIDWRIGIGLVLVALAVSAFAL